MKCSQLYAPSMRVRRPSNSQYLKTEGRNRRVRDVSCLSFSLAGRCTTLHSCSNKRLPSFRRENEDLLHSTLEELRG